MARKSIKGYAEKNYYDNTRFTGGIVATNDPLNEGYFKHMVNFDISDTGASVEPRKGFFTTTFKIKDVVYNGSGDTKDVIFTPSNKTIYFYDASLGKHIFIDSSQDGYKEYNDDDDKDNATYSCILIISADFDIDNKYLTNANLVTKFDWSKLETDLKIKNYTDIEFLQDKAELAIDEYGISRYIIKAEYTVEDKVTPIWVSFVYRKNGSTYEGVTYEADTLVMEYLDFSNTVSINMADRNLASGQSIIPDPIQTINPSNKPPLDFIQQFPLIYVKDSEGKYLINTTKKLDGLQLIPYFQLEKAKEGYDWYYTYDIISTDPGAGMLDSENKFESGIFKLDPENHVSVDDIILKDISEKDSRWSHLYKKYIENVVAFEPFGSQWNLHDIDDEYKDFYIDTWKSIYTEYINNLDAIITRPYLKNNNATIIYVFPKHNYELRIIDYIDFSRMFDNSYTPEEVSSSGTYTGRYMFKFGCKINSTEFSEYIATDFNITNKFEDTHKYTNLNDFLIDLPIILDVNNYLFYVVNTHDCVNYNIATNEGLYNTAQTALNSRINIFKEEDILDFTGLKKVLKNNTSTDFIIKTYTTGTLLTLDSHAYNQFTEEQIRLFPDAIEEFVEHDGKDLKYFLCTNLLYEELQLFSRTPYIDEYIHFDYRNKYVKNKLFKEYFNKLILEDQEGILETNLFVNNLLKSLNNKPLNNPYVANSKDIAIQFGYKTGIPVNTNFK